jgi:hypothetical protein
MLELSIFTYKLRLVKYTKKAALGRLFRQYEGKVDSQPALAGVSVKS